MKLELNPVKFKFPNEHPCVGSLSRFWIRLTELLLSYTQNQKPHPPFGYLTFMFRGAVYVKKQENRLNVSITACLISFIFQQ